MRFGRDDTYCGGKCGVSFIIVTKLPSFANYLRYAAVSVVVITRPEIARSDTQDEFSFTTRICNCTQKLLQ